MICSSVNLLLRMSVSRRNGLLPKNEGIQVARPPIERAHGGHVTSILVATLQERALSFIYNEFRSPGFDLDGQRFSDMLDYSRLIVGSDFNIVIQRRGRKERVRK
jgi:hypothetical protein